MQYILNSINFQTQNFQEKNKQRISKTRADKTLESLVQYLSNTEIKNLTDAKDTSTEDYYLSLENILKIKNIDISNTFQNLYNYFQYADTAKNIDDIALLEEKEHLEYNLKKVMLKNGEDALELLNSDYYFSILQKYLWNQASIKDVEDGK